MVSTIIMIFTLRPLAGSRRRVEISERCVAGTGMGMGTAMCLPFVIGDLGEPVLGARSLKAHALQPAASEPAEISRDRPPPRRRKAGAVQSCD